MQTTVEGGMITSNVFVIKLFTNMFLVDSEIKVNKLFVIKLFTNKMFLVEGGIITKKDLADYKIRWRDPSVTHLKSVNYTVYTTPLPTSGPVLQYILNVLEGQFISANTVLLIETARH